MRGKNGRGLKCHAGTAGRLIRHEIAFRRDESVTGDMRGDLSKSWTATGILTVGGLDRRRAGPTDVAGRYLSPLESDESAPLVIGLAVFADSVVQEMSEDGAGSESYGSWAVQLIRP